MTRKRKQPKNVESFLHEKATRKYIPTAEYQSVLPEEDLTPIQVAFVRRNPDLDPQLVWRGKDMLDWSDLVVPAPPLYIQEKIHPKVLIDDLMRQTQAQDEGEKPEQLDLFADFNGLPDEKARTEFYRHDANWTNRMILGDSLQVMASLAEREGLYGKVQMIYIDPPYGIKFNSNFQWSTTSRDVKDRPDHITREPEQVKAFRDTWRDGIHSYLTYLRDRLTVARDLLTESGSIFVQIGDENVHRVRALMDEVFGDENFISIISFRTTAARGGNFADSIADYILWFAKNKELTKYRQLYTSRSQETESNYDWIETEKGIRQLETRERWIPQEMLDGRKYALSDPTSQGHTQSGSYRVEFLGKSFVPPSDRHWATTERGIRRLIWAERLQLKGKRFFYRRFLDDYPVRPLVNIWDDTALGGFLKGDTKIYVVQTATKVIERCLLMTTDPGDLVLDPTCGSGTTAYVAEQWGRRWITIDTSRVALALARARLMGARYPYYLLADSPEGQHKEAELSGKALSTAPTYSDIRQGFVYQRVPHITLKSIANNAEIDVIWEAYEQKLAPLREQLTEAIAAVDADWLRTWRAGQNYDVELPDVLQEWEIPRQPIIPWPAEAVKLYEGIGKVKSRKTKLQRLHQLNRLLGRSYTLETLPDAPGDPLPEAALPLHQQFWELRIACQRDIDASIAAKADHEYLYDKPYEDKSRVRVAGPFTVESLSPHRVLGVDENDELIDPLERLEEEGAADFVQIILENLKRAGVQQAHKEDRITFTSLAPWPGNYICAEGRYLEGDEETGVMKRAAIFIGPEFGTVTRPDLVAAAKEAGDAGFDVLIALAFSYDARSTEFNKLGRIPVLKARMNADLHMAEDLKATGKGNLFVIFGEPDIDILETDDGQIQVKINGVDVFHPNTGEIRSDGAEGIACWFIDTDYNEESFFVRHAYFLGAGDPYKALKTSLKAEIDRDAWETLYSNISRPFEKPRSGRIAVKVINHLGDEVMKVYKVD